MAEIPTLAQLCIVVFSYDELMLIVENNYMDIITVIKNLDIVKKISKTRASRINEEFCKNDLKIATDNYNKVCETKKVFESSPFMTFVDEININNKVIKFGMIYESLNTPEAQKTLNTLKNNNLKFTKNFMNINAILKDFRMYAVKSHICENLTLIDLLIKSNKKY